MSKMTIYREQIDTTKRLENGVSIYTSAGNEDGLAEATARMNACHSEAGEDVELDPAKLAGDAALASRKFQLFEPARPGDETT